MDKMNKEGDCIITEYSEDEKFIHFFSDYKEIFSVNKNHPVARIKNILPVQFNYIYKYGNYIAWSFIPV